MNRSHILLVLLLLGGSSVSGAAQMGSEVPATTVQSEPNSTQENVAPQGQVQAGLQAVKQWGNDHPRTMTALKVLAGWVAFEVIGNLYLNFLWSSSDRAAYKQLIKFFSDAQFENPEQNAQMGKALIAGMNYVNNFEKIPLCIAKCFYYIKSIFWFAQYTNNGNFAVISRSPGKFQCIGHIRIR